MGRRKSFVDLADDGPMDVTDMAGMPPTRIPVSKCSRRPDNPRPKAMAVDELADSIREFGQIQPATVASRAAYLKHRPDHASEIGEAEWVVLAGNRRHAACARAGKEELLVHVADDRVAEIIEVGIIENIQREPLSPVREAEELQQLHQRYGTTRAVGDKIGKSHVYVSQRLSLLELVPQLQVAVDEGQLKIADARDLAKFPQAQQLARYEAGPPYKPEAKPPPAPAEGVVLGDPETYTRTELGNGVSKRSKNTAPSQELTAGDGVGNAVSKESALVEEPSSPESGNTVSKSLDFSDVPAESGQHPAGNGVSKGLPQLPEPETLVELILKHYTAEQRDLVVQLLWT